jgi:hypothetical protein
LVLEQAENRLHTAVGLLVGLLQDELGGALRAGRQPQLV